MKTFNVTNAKTVAEAQAALANGKAAALAGGTDLISTLKSMCSPTSYDTLVNLKTIPNLSYIKEEGGFLKIGAMTTLTEIAKNDLVKSKYTALAEAARAVGTPQLRNAGTIAGNICQLNRCWYFRGDSNLFHCARKPSGGPCYAMIGDNRYHSIFGPAGVCVAVSPSDTAPVLAAFGATIVTNKKSDWTTNAFFVVTGEKQVAIASDEIVTEIRIPVPAAGTKSAYRKYALRKAFDFPIVGAAAVITTSGGTVSAASVALGAVHNSPRIVSLGSSLTGKAITKETAEAAGEAAIAGATALMVPEKISTTAIGNKYIIQLAKVMTKRAVLACE